MNDLNDPEPDFGNAANFVPPSIDRVRLQRGESYSYYSYEPIAISKEYSSSSCVLGIDEAGRGPVLGPMVYSAFYLPSQLHHTLLRGFNDSKTLTPSVRQTLMMVLCTPLSALQDACGWGVKVLSARDISSGMMRPGTGVYNLNAQAMDATVEIIRVLVEVRRLNISDVYIDTVGNPATYQQKLERIFPSLKITVAKKADSLYPCVSAASIVAKVTRDVALRVLYESLLEGRSGADDDVQGWGSGYPSEAKCTNWLKRNMHPVFGWGNECRFSWGTAKDMLELKGGATVDWPVEEDDDRDMDLKSFLSMSNTTKSDGYDGLRQWYGCKAPEVL